MKKSKNLVTYFAIFLVSVFVVLVGMKIYFEFNSPKFGTSNLSYSLTSTKTDLKVGDKVVVHLYLNGRDAGKASTYDVKLYYDPTKFRLNKTLPGGFFDKYITIKWDQENSWFALAQTPSKPRIMAQTVSPLLSLEFTAIGKSISTPISTGASIVYLTKTGGFHPDPRTVNFSIK
jgi:hypothetical protein